MQNNWLKATAAAGVLAAAQLASASDGHNHTVDHDSAANGPSGHAPIGVMGDHLHKQGEVMFSYRFMRMEMEESREGTQELSTADVLADFMVAPLSMRMDMHMFGAMYAPTDDTTLMFMLPYNEISMDHVNRMGAEFTTEAEGIGDISVSALHRLYQSEDGAHNAHWQLGLSLPTGDIDVRDNILAMSDVKLPYPMQLGSGSYDVIAGLTYQGYAQVWNYGAQARAVLRTGKNDNDYQLGDRYESSLWLARKWDDFVSTSVRLKMSKWERIEGTRDDLNPNMVQTANTANSGGERADLVIGANFVVPGGLLKGQRIALEASKPVYQHLDGPQLETDWVFTAGWQHAL